MLYLDYKAAKYYRLLGLKMSASSGARGWQVGKRWVFLHQTSLTRKIIFRLLLAFFSCVVLELGGLMSYKHLRNLLSDLALSVHLAFGGVCVG